MNRVRLGMTGTGAALRIVLLVVAILSTVTAPLFSATESVTSGRLAGDDRFDTAAEIALATFPDGSSSALIAYGYTFPDALAASYLAGYEGAPVLLTDTSYVPSRTLQTLRDLGVDNCIVVGGVHVVSEPAVSELESECTVTRLSGEERYETAEAIATAVPKDLVGELGTKGRTALVATGETFADALSAGPLAYEHRFPMILTRPDTLSEAASRTIAVLDIDHAIVLGGTHAVGVEVETALTDRGITVQRVAGDTRYGTAIKVAHLAAEEFGHPIEHANVAAGYDAVPFPAFVDALALAPHSAGEGPIILCAASTTCGSETLAFFEAHAATISSIHVGGGTTRVSADAERALVVAATT